ncbi:MAG: hypothetical protein ABJB74_18295, partial [Gemmatimonas sp.]
MPRSLRFLVGSAISLSATAIIACAGGSDKGITVPPPTPTVSVSPSASTVSASTATPGTLNISVTRGGGYTGAITLSADGLPTGVTASFNPSSLPNGTTISVLTLNAGATAVAATNNITIRAAGSSVTDATAPVALTVTSVVVPDYSLSAAPAAVTVTAGASGTSTISINRTGAFASNVTLALTGNPAGVTGTFTPNPATANTSDLSIVTTAATVPGTYALTITGTATGATPRTTTVSLTVNAIPGVTVALSPATLSIVAGATGQTGVTIARVGGLSGDVAVTAESLPAGVTLAA